MRRVLACSLFLGLAGLLLGADDPFVGTWKLNLEKSKFSPSQPGRATKEEILTIEMTGDDGTVTMKGTRGESGGESGTDETVPGLRSNFRYFL